MPNIWDSRGRYVVDPEDELRNLGPQVQPTPVAWEPAPYRARPSRPTAAQDFHLPFEENSMSEREAERLYGPAPEGDEDPHASQAVPDPGETSGPQGLQQGSTTFSAAFLCGAHLGQRMRVSEQRGPTQFGIVGTLTRVEHEADLISERTLGSAQDTIILGRRRVLVKLRNGTADIFRPDATVELLD